MDLVQQDFWDKSYESYDREATLPLSNPIIPWIERVSSLSPAGSCLEIGAFPGSYSNEFGKRGHLISGIDLTPRITELNTLFRSRNYRVGQFSRQDFFRYPVENKYDIVFSIGFIEHFNDYLSVIGKHSKLVKDNGLLFIAVPNFRGKLQHFLHRMMNKENLEIHNIASMNPDQWANSLKDHGFEIIQKGYIGGFDFWTGSMQRNYLQIIGRRLMVNLLTPLLNKLFKKPSASYSPYCGMIARKKITNHSNITK